jgi:hypothetical protein
LKGRLISLLSSFFRSPFFSPLRGERNENMLPAKSKNQNKEQRTKREVSEKGNHNMTTLEIQQQLAGLKEHEKLRWDQKTTKTKHKNKQNESYCLSHGIG